MSFTYYNVMPGSMTDYLFEMTPGITIDTTKNASLDMSVYNLSKYKLVAAKIPSSDGKSTITFHR